MSPQEAAPLLGLHRDTVYRLLLTRQLRHRRVGPGRRRYDISEADIKAYLDSCVVEPVGAEPAKHATRTARKPVVRDWCGELMRGKG